MAHPSRLAFLVLTLCLSAFILSPGPAQALSLQVNGGGILTGATGVNVGGALYDVQFLDGTCSALFSGCDQTTDFIFQTQANALLAGQALLDQVFLNSTLGNFDTGPNLTQGCTNAFVCNVGTPFQLTSTNIVSTYNSVNSSSLSDSTQCCSSFTTVFNSGTFPTFTYARWSPAAANPVPEPSTIALFGLGLIALVFWDYRRRQAHPTGTQNQ